MFRSVKEASASWDPVLSRDPYPLSNVRGPRPLEGGVIPFLSSPSFLPFSFGIVIATGSSNIAKNMGEPKSLNSLLIEGSHIRINKMSIDVKIPFMLVFPITFQTKQTEHRSCFPVLYKCQEMMIITALSVSLKLNLNSVNQSNQRYGIYRLRIKKMLMVIFKAGLRLTGVASECLRSWTEEAKAFHLTEFSVV